MITQYQTATPPNNKSPPPDNIKAPPHNIKAPPPNDEAQPPNDEAPPPNDEAPPLNYGTYLSIFGTNPPPYKGGNKSKLRDTICFFVNATGESASLPVVIWKSAKPRCFKGITKSKLPVSEYCCLVKETRRAQPEV